MKILQFGDIMFEQIFGDSPRVKVINFILIDPSLKYNKKQLALGSGIARSTLDTFLDDLITEGFLKKDKNKYILNENSPYVRILLKTQIQLADVAISKLSKDFIEEERLSDEEIDEIFDENYDFDIDEELEKLEFQKNNNSEAIYYIEDKKEVVTYGFA